MDSENQNTLEEVVSDTNNTSIASSKASSKKFFSEIFWGLSLALCGYFLGSATLPFGARPFGTALLCAVGGRALPVLLGLSLSSLDSSHPALFISAYAIAVLVRLIVSLLPNKSAGGPSTRNTDIMDDIFNEPISSRILTSALTSFLLGAYFFISGGYLYYDMFGTLISFGSSIVATLLFSGALDKKYSLASSLYAKLGLSTLICATVFATKEIYFFGISLSVLISMTATLVITQKFGLYFGLPLSVLSGLCFSLSYMPIFVVGALSIAVFKNISPTLASFSAFLSSVSLGFYINGISALGDISAACFTSSVLFFMFEKLSAIDKKEKESASKEAPVKDNNTEKVISSVQKEEMSENISEEVAPKELEKALPKALDAHALDSLRLWSTAERAKELCGAFSSLSSVLFETSKRELYSKPKALEGDSVSSPDLLDISDKSDIFAEAFDNFSDVIADSMSSVTEDFKISKKSSEKLSSLISETLPSSDISSGLSVAVFGNRKKQALIVSEGKELSEAEISDISAALRSVLGKFERVSDDPCFEDFDGRTIYDTNKAIRFASSKKISVSHAERTLRAEGEGEFCGDSVGLFYDGDDRFYSFISDGMGSGQDASVTSGLVSLFLCKLLSSSCPTATVLKMINSFLRSRNSSSAVECSATVDLLELDMLSSKATFYKNGASPTYVFRGGSLFKVKARSTPLGILKNINTKKVSFDISPGDLIVMVSDGVTGGKEDCPHLFELIRNISSGEPDRIAELIVKYAKSENSVDDVSVIVLRVEDSSPS